MKHIYILKIFNRVILACHVVHWIDVQTVNRLNTTNVAHGIIECTWPHVCSPNRPEANVCKHQPNVMFIKKTCLHTDVS